MKCPDGTKYVHRGHVRWSYKTKKRTTTITEKTPSLCVDKKPPTNLQYYVAHPLFRFLANTIKTLITGKSFKDEIPDLGGFSFLGWSPISTKKHSLSDPVAWAYARGAKQYCKALGKRLPTEAEVRYLIKSGLFTFFNMPNVYKKNEGYSHSSSYVWFTQSNYRVGTPDIGRNRVVKFVNIGGKPATDMGACIDSSFFCVADAK